MVNIHSAKHYLIKTLKIDKEKGVALSCDSFLPIWASSTNRFVVFLVDYLSAVVF